MNMVSDRLGSAIGTVMPLLERSSLHEPSPTDVMALKDFLHFTHKILAASTDYRGGFEALLRDRTTAATLLGKLLRMNGMQST